MSSFDVFMENNSDFLHAVDLAVWKAGAQSRQDEIDELKKQIDEVILKLEVVDSSMWEEQIQDVLYILKGNQS